MTEIVKVFGSPAAGARQGMRAADIRQPSQKRSGGRLRRQAQRDGYTCGLRAIRGDRWRVRRGAA
jgi:hypothetical protein